MAKTNQTDYTYVASGSPDFLVPFPYLSTSEVEVTVDGASTGVIWTAAQSIQLTPTPAVGVLVRVRRNTDARDVRNDFSAGAPFSPRNINENNEQLLYVAQEAVNASQVASDVASGVAATAAGAVATANAADAKAQLALDTVQGSGVNSFKSRTGAVMPAAGDYTAAQITHNASNVGDTLDGLQSAVTLLTDATVAQTSATGAAVIPAGTEAQRPASPVNGQLRYNSEKNQFEGYQNGQWSQVGSANAAQLASDYANLSSRTTSLEAGIKQTPELLWSGNVVTVRNVLTLSRSLQVGDLVWLAHADSLTQVTAPLVITADKLVPGAVLIWAFGQSGGTECHFNGTNQLTVSFLSDSYPLGKIYASRAKN